MVRISVSNRGSLAASLKLEYRIGSPGAYTCRKVSVWSLLSADFFLPPTKPKAESTRPPTPALDAIDRAPPPPPPPPAPTAEEQLKKVEGFLQAEIDDGIVEVFQKGNTLIIRIKGSGMFGSGSDELSTEFRNPVNRVAEALNDEPGPVIVAGHSDNVPIRSARFPSNLALSLARAQSVMTSMSRAMADPSRLSAEGRADKEPIADNGTREGRAANRRIEVLLVRETDQ